MLRRPRTVPFLLAFVMAACQESIATAADFMYVTNGGQGPSFVSR